MKIVILDCLSKKKKICEGHKVIFSDWKMKDEDEDEV